MAPSPTPIPVARTPLDLKAETCASERMQKMSKARLTVDVQNSALHVYYPRRRIPVCLQLLTQTEVDKALSLGTYDDCFELAARDETLFWNTVQWFGTRVDVLDQQIQKKIV